MLTVLACLARHSGSQWCFQCLASIPNGLFELLVLRANEINNLVIFWHYRVSVFHWTIYASPSAQHFFPISARVLAINDLAWMLLAVLSVSLRTTKIRLEVSLVIE